MSNLVKLLYLPETMANWPWPRAINPHYEEVKAELDAWLHSFKVFSAQSQYAFDKCDFARLASLAYPWVSKEHLRTGCDLMHLFFVIDEYTNVEHEPVVHNMVDIVIDALKNPRKPHPEGEVVLGEIARQFWDLAIKTASPASQHHLIESFTAYLESIVQHAADRDRNTYRSIASYLENRRENVGARPSFALIELDLNLPDEVLYHPIIGELSVHIIECLFLITFQDIVSYNKEQAIGDDRPNILTLAMHKFKIDLDGTMNWVVNYHTEAETKFLGSLKRVPSWGPDVDRQVRQYLDRLPNWPRGNDCWSFESRHYFENKGLDIQKTRHVPLLPKVTTLKERSSVFRSQRP